MLDLPPTYCQLLKYLVSIKFILIEVILANHGICITCSLALIDNEKNYHTHDFSTYSLFSPPLVNPILSVFLLFFLIN